MSDGEEGFAAAYREPKGDGEPGLTDGSDELRYFPERELLRSSLGVGGYVADWALPRGAAE